MSTASKVTFGMACLTSVGIIGYVHYKQIAERTYLHDGVIRDVKRRESFMNQLNTAPASSSALTESVTSDQLPVTDKSSKQSNDNPVRVIHTQA